jgi:Leucine-rich repeat (LRR) protein
VNDLDLSSSLPPLDGLTALNTLNLSGSGVTTLLSLNGLTALETLDLGGSGVTTLPSLDRLTALTFLRLGPLFRLLTDAEQEKLRARGVKIY